MPSARARARDRARRPLLAAAPIAAVSLAAALLSAPPAGAQDTQLYWGDTHLHTSHSTDAYGSGNWTIDPEQAFRFARGMPVIHSTFNTRTRISRPLDFLVVADHSDFLGLQQYVLKQDPRLMADPVGRRLYEIASDNPSALFRMIFGADPEISREQMIEAYAPLKTQPWLDEIDAAERNNEPGVFTAFAGWEWSAQPNSRNLHRIVFTPAPADELRTFFPISNLDTQRPEDFWAWLESTSAEIGSDFVAIPHNSNMSDGLMFGLVDSDGQPIDAAYARTRARWEPVVEMTQVKGTSETRPELSPNDEFAEFEIYRRLFMAKEPTPNAADYVRPALLRGLEIEARTGVNPYKFGLIGASDIHTGMSNTDEFDFGGAIARNAAPADRAAAAEVDRPPNLSASLDAWDLSAAGLAGVWATENTREAITAAFKRREVYGSTGPRISLRVFGGFRFRERDAAAEDLPAAGYARGVAMGGDLTAAPSGRAPQLLIQAVRDPRGANLDRVQVVKGWLDADGESHEQIYEAAWSGDRAIGPDGRLPAVGNTVDAADASYDNSIGAPELRALWTDPDFDPAQKAFYYVRVLEIPTPRHHVYDAVALEMDPATLRYPTSIQERAYSSPIWYAPG